VTKKYL
jgi:hypothetical protein